MVPSSLDDIVSSLILTARAAEARGPLEGHSDRVAHAARGIGRELGLPDEQCDRLMLMGRLHNLGIVGTRDSVLRKTGPLTADEYEHIRNHTILGAKILAPIRELDDVAEVCLNHHERWDGSGYPNGLVGKAIPFNARIIAVADVFSALISSRPHRDSLPRPVAADMLEEEQGTKQCPEAVQGFLKWFARTGGIIDLPGGE